MVTVILEVMIHPGGRRREEEYFCREVLLPFLPSQGLEYMLTLGEREPDQFNVTWVRWYQAEAHAVVRLELSKLWPKVMEEELFDLSIWKKGTRYETFR